jgi:hypothetical protein
VFSSLQPVDNVLVTLNSASFPPEIQVKPQVLKLNLSKAEFENGALGDEI